VLEAIYLLAVGKSSRVSKEEEMIMEGKDLARISGKVDYKDGSDKLEIILTRGRFLEKRTAKKRFLLNDTAKRMGDFVGKLKAVLFRPEDMDVVLGPPGNRRDFLDNILCQTDQEYLRCLMSYKKGLRQRNRILEKIRDRLTDERQLYFWDELLIKNGGYIMEKREELINYINSCRPDNNFCINLFYDRSVISRERLEKYKSACIATATTLVGPHRDEIEILKIKNKKSNIDKNKGNIDKENLAHYGSRGEQRLGVLALKLSELDYVKEKSRQKLVLLLDDIFSELDDKHRHQVLEAVKKQQTIMTTTERDWLEKEISDKINIITF